MTQIYTENTVLVKAKSPIVNFNEGDMATLSVDIDLIWVQVTAAQRFLTHKWQESSDGGISWRDIDSGVSDHPLSADMAPTKTTSVLNNPLKDLSLAEFNLAKTQPISSSLTIDNVLKSQNNYLYRCIVLLFNNDLNTIESVGSSEHITLNVGDKAITDPLPAFDIPWDPMNPRGVLQAGSLTFDQNTKIELFKLYKDACGTQWRIREVSAGNDYLSGNITNGVVVGLPKSYGPNSQTYPGYMQLQFYCNNTWVAQESWISLVGNKEHVFDQYGPVSPINIAINGETVLDSVLLGTEKNPLSFKPQPNLLGGTNISAEGNLSVDSITAVWNPGGQNGYGGVLGIIPDSVQTITVPAVFSLPVQVTITGSNDDDLVVNGQIVNDGSPNFAGTVNYTFSCDTRTFTIGVYNAFAGGAGYNYTISFTGNKNNSLGSNLIIREGSTNILTINQASSSKNLSVSASDTNWTDTGISLFETSRLLISATGSVQWSSNNFSSPTGVGSGNTILYSGIPQAALVAKIGLSGTPFYVGDYFNNFANSDGTLYLSVNDSAKGDNAGNYAVKIQYANTDPLGIKITKPNSEIYNSNTHDLDFNKVSLLLKSDNDSINDMSVNSRVFTSSNVSFRSDITKYGGFVADYTERGYSVADSDSSFNFDKDFTIEGWFYFTRNDVGYQGLISTYRNTNYSGLLLTVETNNTLAFYATENSYGYWPINLSTNYIPPTGQWLYIVVQRLGSSIKMYANGVEIGSTNSSMNITSGYKIELGNYPYFNVGRRSFQGYMDEVRITKGLARYPQGNPINPNNPFPKLPYNSLQYVDISSSQKSATPVYDTVTGALKYYVFNSTNSYVGPFNKPGQLSIVYSYLNGSPISQQDICQSYFQAFDGSSRYFRKLGVYDLDCCSLGGNYVPDDGYYIISKRCDGQYEVVDSVRWYAANGYAIGNIVAYPTIVADNGHPRNSATWRSMGYGPNCCNADGTKDYYELTDEVLIPLTPTPTVTPTRATPTPTPTVTATNTVTPSITPSVTSSPVAPSFDPLYNDVVLLLNMSGVNNSKIITDSSLLNTNISVTGNAVISTAQSKFGGSSLLVPAATSNKNAVYLPSSNAFNFGSGNFTIEFWLRQNNSGPTQSGARVFQTSENNDLTSGIDIHYPSNSNSLIAKLSNGVDTTVTLSMGPTDTSSWNHYAIVRNNHNITTYLNGTQVASVYRELTLANSTGNIIIGGNATVGPDRSINAYLDDFRITKSARYNNNFMSPLFQMINVGPPITPTPTVTSTITSTPTITPTITPTSGLAPSPTPTQTSTPTSSVININDPLWSSVALLMPLNGAQDSSNIIDVSNNPAAFTNTNNSIVLKTDIKQYGTASAYMVANGNATATSSKFIIGNNNFTLELWAYSTVTTGNNDRGIIHLRSSNNTYSGIGIGVTQFGNWGFYAKGSEQAAGSIANRVQNTWVHLAISRNSGVLKFFVNGVEALSISDTTNYTMDTIYFGNWYNTNNRFTGYIDDVRLTIGSSRYNTSPFTVPLAHPTS